jgi:1-acyl-sn-glycerol-3-phosphate acyltransferase
VASMVRRLGGRDCAGSFPPQWFGATGGSDLQPFKRLLFVSVGVFQWTRFNFSNRLRFEGLEHVARLPAKGVLFVSNHLTYYLDVMAIHQAFTGTSRSPLAGFRANLNVRFIAAAETLNERGLLPRIFNYTGAVLIRRTWRDGEREVQRPVDPTDIRRIGEALRAGWLITFPHGTTRPGAPVRKGTAHIIREHQPIVVPVILDGLDRAFSRTGFRRIARNVEMSVRFGAPLAIRAEDTVDRIVEILAEATSPGMNGGPDRTPAGA